MKQPLILVAASGLARETLEAVRVADQYEVIGVVDDNETIWGTLFDGVKVLGGLEVVDDYPDASLLLCAGKGAIRHAIADRLSLDDSRYATVIHQDASLGRTCTIGAGSIILAGCVLTASVSVGRHVVLMPHVVCTHDDVTEDYATLCAGVTLGGRVRVGHEAYVGMVASVREDVVIGAHALIGMGSTVVSDVPPDEVWFGVPARRAGAASREQLGESH